MPNQYKQKYTEESFAGTVFGRWTVLSLSHRSEKSDYWFCRCSCGKEKIVSGIHLRRNMSQSCGCLRRELKIKERTKDMLGLRFGKLLVASMSDKKTRGNTGSRYWNCVCDCGNTTLTPGHTLRSGLAQSCGCVSINKLAERSKKQIGSLNPAYNPNLADSDRKPRNVKELSNWRKSVYERDDYRCVLTGKRGGRLHAHHIDGWNHDVDKRFDVDNGVTLSEFAHKLFHAMFGRGNNTKEQYTTFARSMQIAEAAT
jgi:hypothetical protein